MSSESTIANTPDKAEITHFPEVIFPAGNSDFRAARNRCAQACREFNNTPDDADPEERSQKWLDIVRPDRDRTEDGVLAVTHDQTFANPALKAKTPFVKPPVFIDYGIRLHVGGSTFINRNCMIMDTPVADVVIGEGCNIGSNCCIIGVTHPVRLDERLQRHSIGQPVTIGNDVWIGANVTILGGVTIGDGAVIGACSLVKRDVPPMTVAYGVPARVVCSVKDVKPTLPAAAAVTHTLAEARALRNRLPPKRDGYFAPSAAPAAPCSSSSSSSSMAGDDEGEDGDVVEEEGLLDFDLLDVGLDEGLGDADVDRRSARRPFSVASGSTAHSVLRAGVRERLTMGSERDKKVKAMLLQRRRQQQHRVRRWAVKVVAALTVVIALLVLFFFAGLYLGTSKLTHKDSGNL